VHPNCNHYFEWCVVRITNKKRQAQPIGEVQVVASDNYAGSDHLRETVPGFGGPVKHLGRSGKR